jgi:hypothetical protein
MSTKSGITATVLFSLTVLTLMMNGSIHKAVALPANEVATTYYETAAKTKEVGSSTLLCNGQRVMEGRATLYSRRTSEPCNLPPHDSGGSGLPCEFLAQGCSPFPRQR